MDGAEVVAGCTERAGSAGPTFDKVDIEGAGRGAGGAEAGAGSVGPGADVLKVGAVLNDAVGPAEEFPLNELCCPLVRPPFDLPTSAAGRTGAEVTGLSGSGAVVPDAGLGGSGAAAPNVRTVGCSALGRRFEGTEVLEPEADLRCLGMNAAARALGCGLD